jgi:hypothetical protein
MDNLLSSYLTSRDADDEAPEVNPYDHIFGAKIVKKLINKKSYIEKLSFADFRSKIEWGNKQGYPQFVIDLIFYIA